MSRERQENEPMLHPHGLQNYIFVVQRCVLKAFRNARISNLPRNLVFAIGRFMRSKGAIACTKMKKIDVVNAVISTDPPEVPIVDKSVALLPEHHFLDSPMTTRHREYLTSRAT